MARTSFGEVIELFCAGPPHSRRRSSPWKTSRRGPGEPRESPGSTMAHDRTPVARDRLPVIHADGRPTRAPGSMLRAPKYSLRRRQAPLEEANQLAGLLTAPFGRTTCEAPIEPTHTRTRDREQQASAAPHRRRSALLVAERGGHRGQAQGGAAQQRHAPDGWWESSRVLQGDAHLGGELVQRQHRQRTVTSAEHLRDHLLLQGSLALAWLLRAGSSRRLHTGAGRRSATQALHGAVARQGSLMAGVHTRTNPRTPPHQGERDDEQKRLERGHEPTPWGTAQKGARYNAFSIRFAKG